MPCVRIAPVLIFVKNKGLTRMVPQVSDCLQGKKNLVFKLGGSQQFKNDRFSWLVLNNSRTIGFLGWFSQAKSQKFQYCFWRIMFLHLFDKIIDFEYIFSNL
jgi:hypothetical protein